MNAAVMRIKDKQNLNEIKIKRQIEAIERFSRAETPEEEEEIKAFLKFMDKEEERKSAQYAL